jgi:hypothetical protein
MHPTQHRRHFRALILIAFLSLGDAASAVPQMATRIAASLAVTQPATAADLDEVGLAPAAATYPRELYAGRDGEAYRATSSVPFPTTSAGCADTGALDCTAAWRLVEE